MTLYGILSFFVYFPKSLLFLLILLYYLKNSLPEDNGDALYNAVDLVRDYAAVKYDERNQCPTPPQGYSQH
jgi:hypothetical protein